MSLPPGVPLSEIPAGKPPSGVTPNFHSNSSLAPAITTVSVIMMIWAVSFVVLRVYANLRAPRGLGLDDYFCVIATALALAYTGIILSLNRFARHSYDIPLSALNGDYFKRSYAQGMILGPTLFFGKSAIFLLYLRLFTINKKMRYCIWFGLAWTFVLYWINIPFESWNCAPRAGDPWGLETVGKTCVDNIMFGLVQGVLAVALDLYIFFLPIPIILNLQMSLNKRLAVLGVFATAILGIVAAIVAMVYRIKLYTTADPSWAAASLSVCITCENYVAVIVSSMPAFAAFSRGSITNVSWIASIRLRLLKSRYSSSRSKASTSYVPDIGIDSSAERMVPGHHGQGNGYLELENSLDPESLELRSVRTQIQGAAFSPNNVAEGVIKKGVDIHQMVQ